MNTRKLLFKSLGVGLNALSYVAPQRAGDLTFHLFATPPKPNVRPKEKAFLDTAERHDFTHEGFNIPVYHWGPADGPVILCAYGWGYNAGRWRHYVPRLVEAGYRVVAFDPVGHGYADKGMLHFPRLVAIEQSLLRQLGGCELALVHSFGGGCLIEAIAGMDRRFHPKRMCVMGVFSEVRWIFLTFAKSLNLRDVVFQKLAKRIEKFEGRSLDEYDVARRTEELAHIQSLIIHDPEDATTAFRNAARNHSHWRGSALYPAKGAGHHLGTAEVTRYVLDFLIEGRLPDGATVNNGAIEPMPAMLTVADLEASGGVSDYYR